MLRTRVHQDQNPHPTNPLPHPQEGAFELLCDIDDPIAVLVTHDDDLLGSGRHDSGGDRPVGVAAAAGDGSCYRVLTTSPVVGLRITGLKFGRVWKSSTPSRASRLPELVS
jgi:hypothetical protein